MIWAFFAVVALGLVGVFAALVTSRWTYDPVAEPVGSAADPGLPDTVHARDVDGVRFDTALRGYRMDQVDEVLDRLRNRLAEQEALVEEAGRPPAAPVVTAPVVTEPVVTDHPVTRPVDAGQPVDAPTDA